MTFYPLEKINNIRDGYLKRFDVDGRDMLLVNSGGNTYLIDNRCPHDGSPLNRARLSNGCIQCPKHKIVFRLNDGQALGGDAVSEVQPIVLYELVEKDGMLGILIS